MAQDWGLRVGIVEPTTLLGRDVRSVLEERKLPVGKLRLFHASTSREGLITAGEEDEAEFITPLDADSLEECQVAFLCGGGAALAKALENRTDGCLAIDLSGLRTGGPFVVPDPESEPLPAGNLFLTYDPTAYVLSEAVRLLAPLGALSGITVSVDRPASELGRAALDELFKQAMAMATFKGIPKEVFPGQSAFNFYHPVDSEEFDGRVREDLARLMGENEVPIGVLSARAGVFHGHHIRLEARFEGLAPEIAEVSSSLFAAGTGFVEPDPESPAGPVESASRDDTLVLRLSASEGSVRIAMASDHLRRGAAHLALRVAEKAVRERGLLADA